MTPETANTIYTLLVAICGAPENDRDSFIQYVTEPQTRLEWRFSGCLGFGGKFRVDGERFYVDCYPEDETPEREATIKSVNDVLAYMVAATSRAAAAEAENERMKLLLRDSPSGSMAAVQALAWLTVFDFCVELGMPQTFTAGQERVISFIKSLAVGQPESDANHAQALRSVAEAKARLELARDALNKFGQHAEGCATSTLYSEAGGNIVGGHCACGYINRIAALSATIERLAQVTGKAITEQPSGDSPARLRERCKQAAFNAVYLPKRDDGEDDWSQDAADAACHIRSQMEQAIDNVPLDVSAQVGQMERNQND